MGLFRTVFKIQGDLGRKRKYFLPMHVIDVPAEGFLWNFVTPGSKTRMMALPEGGESLTVWTFV